MTIKVGFDYDEPLFPWYDYAHDASVATGLTTMDQDPPTVWDPHSHYGCTDEQWFEVLDHEVLLGDLGMYGRALKPGVVADMYRLKNRGIEIHLVTARGQFGTYGERIKQLTWEQVKREQVPYTTLTFTQDKFTTIRDLGLDYFIDDRPRYFDQAVDAGADAYLLDERWNQDFPVEDSRRVFTTRQYIDLIVKNHDEGGDRGQ